MARLRFYEVDGHRHPSADVTEITERACDGCGRFMTPDEGVAGNVQVTVYGGASPLVPFDAHPEHAVQALADAMRKVSELVQWPPAF